MTTTFQAYQEPIGEMNELDREYLEEHSWDREIDRLHAQDEAGYGTDTWPENTIQRLDVYLTRRQPSIPFAELPKADQDYLLALSTWHSAEWTVEKYLRQKHDEGHVSAFVADCEARLRRINEHRAEL